MKWKVLIFFFFKQKTAYEMRISDWSSDVCSSDLVVRQFGGQRDRLVCGNRCRAVEAGAGHVLGISVLSVHCLQTGWPKSGATAGRYNCGSARFYSKRNVMRLVISACFLAASVAFCGGTALAAEHLAPGLWTVTVTSDAFAEVAWVLIE